MLEILQKYVDVIPVILDIIDLDAMMAVTDGEKFVGYFPGKKMKADIQVGSRLQQTDPMHECFLTGRKLVQNVPEGIYGFAFKSISMPIKENGKIVGTLGFAMSLEKDHYISKSFGEMRTSMESIQEDIREVKDFTSNVGTEVIDFTELLEHILKDFNHMKQSAEGIKAIAFQSNILSLNASIEAARAGESGRGFAVVAEQMQEHSNKSKQSSEEVIHILESIHGDVEKANQNLIELKESFTNQSTAIEDMGKTLESLKKISDSLAGFLEKN